ncbi:hypothetical protein PybrP1_011760 [[Pythium] brassicae (nom. inval.)]|nr:hypothetical protein PybrP1_011760 [[Pythium] brassicae (nom. inval.)]
MSFEENMTAFYMAFAEQALEPMCQALSNMRLAVQNDRVKAAASAPHEQEAAAVRDEMLRACETKAQAMQDVALEQLAAACGSEQSSSSSSSSSVDVDQALTAFFLCAELGAEARAVVPFERCLSRVFRAQARASLARVAASKRAAAVTANGYIDRGFYVEAVREILTGATDIMNAVADAAVQPATLRHVLQPLHATCSDVILEVVRLYEVDARVAAWERRAQAQAQAMRTAGHAGDNGDNGDNDNDNDDTVEADESLQMVDLFLDEASFLVRLLGSYSAFLPTLCDGLDSARGGGSFHGKLQELSGVYLLLERFYVFQSVRKATAIAEPQALEPHVFVSSVVEDVAFVLNKAFFRASQCMNYHTALSVVIAIVDALESLYLPSILALPRRDFALPLAPAIAAAGGGDTAPAQGGGGHNPNANPTTTNEPTPRASFSAMLLQAVDDDLAQAAQDEAKLIMAINSAFMSGEFVDSLRLKIESFSAAAFPRDANVVECLPKPIGELTDVFRAVVDTEIQEMLARGVGPRTHARVQQLVAEQLSYVLTPAQYDAFGVAGSPLTRMVELDVMQNAVLRRYERALCTPPFEALVAYLVRGLADALERALLAARKPFNDLGALQLERDVSAVLARVSAFVQDSGLRAGFTRLFQLVLVLNLMDPQHVVDYVDSVAEELSVADIETLLRMRVDFKHDAVARAVAAVRHALAARRSHNNSNSSTQRA